MNFILVWTNPIDSMQVNIDNPRGPEGLSTELNFWFWLFSTWRIFSSNIDFLTYTSYQTYFGFINLKNKIQSFGYLQCFGSCYIPGMKPQS